MPLIARRRPRIGNLVCPYCRSENINQQHIIQCEGKAPLISVIITNNVAEKNITIDYIKAQTYRNIEIINIIDDKKNGVNYCINKGFEKSKGQFILFIENNIGLDNETISRLYNELKEKGNDYKGCLVKREDFGTKKEYSSVIYTSINGKYPYKREDLKCFGDDKIFQNPIMESKRYKVLPHLFFEDDIRIWIDGNIWSKESKEYLISRFLGDSDLAIFKHPYRENVWQEFETLRTEERFQIDFLQKQLKEQQEFYRKQGLPENTPLWECNFVISRNTEKVNRLLDAWWSEICRWQWRDQVSFPYVMWKYGKDIKMNTIEEGNIRNHKLFKYLNH